MGARTTDFDVREGGDAIASCVLWESLVLYAIAFFLPALDKSHGEPARGYSVFFGALFGCVLYSVVAIHALAKFDPSGLLILILLAPWWANFAYWLAAYRLSKGRTRGVVALSALAVLLGLSSCAIVTFWWLTFPAGRRGPPPFLSLREGYWLWLGSMALPACVGFVGQAGRPRRAKDEEMAQACDD